MKKLHFQVLLLALITINSLSLNGMFVNSARRYRSTTPMSTRTTPAMRTTSTAQTTMTPFERWKAGESIYKPQNWFDKLVGGTRTKPEFDTPEFLAQRNEYYAEQYKNNLRNREEDRKRSIEEEKLYRIKEERANLEKKLKWIEEVITSIKVQEIADKARYDAKIINSPLSNRYNNDIWFVTHKQLSSALHARSMLELPYPPLYIENTSDNREAMRKDIAIICKKRDEIVAKWKEINKPNEIKSQSASE